MHRSREKSWLSEARETFGLALPIMAGLVGQMLMGVADTLMVGRVGTVPLAAVSLGSLLSHVLMVTGFGAISGITVFAAHAFGSGRPAEGAEVLRNGLWLSLATGVLGAIVLVLVRNHLTLAGQPAAVVREASHYLFLVGGSLVPLMLSQLFKQYSEALARPWPPMAIYTGGVLLNILLNWIFIYGRCGAPAMGVTGAGLATLLARGAVLLGVVVWLVKDARLKIWLPANWLTPPSLDGLKRLTLFGAPVAFLHFLEVGAFAFAGLMTGWIGPGAMAANQIAITCAATTFTFALGFAMAVGIRVGHAWGRNDLSRLRQVGLNGMSCSALVMGVFAILFLTLRQSISGLFSPDADVVALAASLLLVAAFFQLFDGQQVLAIFALRGMGDVRIPATIAVLAYWCLAIPTGYVLAFRFDLGAFGIWIGLALGLALLGLTLGWRFHRLTHVKPQGASA